MKRRNKRRLNVLLIAVATVAQRLQEVTKGAGIQMRENETMIFHPNPIPSKPKGGAANIDTELRGGILKNDSKMQEQK